jgi:hypothetical protein
MVLQIFGTIAVLHLTRVRRHFNKEALMAIEQGGIKYWSILPGKLERLPVA